MADAPKTPATPKAPAKGGSDEAIIELITVTPWALIVVAAVVGVIIGAIVIAVFTETDNDG